MLYLKKYFTEGLIQVAILLSLCRVQVEVGLEPFLPPSIQEILLGHTSALTPTQPHHLHHHGLHPKSVDLDGFFTARRLLGFVHSLDRLQVPHAEVETWLVQREPGPLPGGRPDQPSPLERPAAGTRRSHAAPLMELRVRPVDQEEEEEEEEEEHVVHHNGSVVDRGEEDLNRRSSSEGGGGAGGFSGHINAELTENQADQTSVSLQECLRLLEETFPFTEEQELSESGDRREDLQCRSVNREPSLCHPEDLEVHWQDLLSIMEPENTDAETESLHHNFNSGSPGTGAGVGSEVLTTESRDSSLFMQSLPTQHGFEDGPAASLLPLTPSTELDDHGSSLDSKASLTNNLFHSPPDHTDLLEEDLSEDFSTALNTDDDPFDMGLLTPDVVQSMDLETPSDVDVNIHSRNPTPSGFSPSPGNEATQDLPAPSSSVFLAKTDVEDEDLPLIDLLENASMLEEISQLDAALEEGFSPEMAARLEEEGYLHQELSQEQTGRNDDHVDVNRENPPQPESDHQEIENEADSDSGLSLDFSHSPASPCVSEATSYSSSSSSTSSSSCMSAEGSPFTEDEDEEAEESSAGSDMEIEMTIKQEELEEEEEEEEMGAVGGGYPGDTKKYFTFKPGNHKLLQDFPWMEHVGHDHTYNQPWSSSSPPSVVKMTNKHAKSAATHHNAKPYHRSFSSRLTESKMWSRDERRARTLRIPFSNDIIVNLPVEEFNDLLTKYHLNEDQLNLIKDIRRRGKNKIAAQNCRKRKQDVLASLEDDVSGLRRHRLQLLREKEEALRTLREMKQQLGMLYQEVFSTLRDEGGRPLDAAEYLLQFGPDSTVTVASRQNGAEAPPTGGKASRKQKDKKK